MGSHECPTCGRVFDARRGLGVHHSRVHGERLSNRECAECGERFYSEYERKYCSEECLDEGVSFEGKAHPNYSGGKETTSCDICGAEFDYYPSDKEGKYCSDCVENEPWRDPPVVEGSDHPRWVGGRSTYACEVCGETIERYPSELSGDVTLCSPDCQSEWVSEAFAGDGHPNWEGGTTESYGRGWNETRSKALERDDYECVVCGTGKEELGRNPDVHHIVPVRAFRESDDHDVTDAHYPENVVTLCPPCHRKADFGKIPKDRLRAAVTENADGGDATPADGRASDA